MSILICKQCKESYNTSWGYHNDDYCISHCHIESLEAENTELKAALTNIQAVAVNNLDHDMHRVYKMCDEALKATK